MSTSYWGQIAFNPNYFNDPDNLKRIASNDALSGFHPKNSGIREYGVHEAGHILEIALIKKYGGDFTHWQSHIQASKIVIRAFDNIKTISENDVIRFRKKISMHATNYGVAECFAEAVADYVRNKENAASLSKEIWNLLLEELS